MPNLTRRDALLAGSLWACGVSAAQDARPVALVVPYPAGGLSDTIARIVERPLGRSLGRQVIVENVGGVGGAIGAQKVLAAPADGGMLYQGSPNELILAPMALSAVRYKSEDFRPVQMIGAFPIAIVTRKGLPANNVDELVALARRAARSGRPLTYGSVGVGSFYHVLGAHFAKTIDAPMTHVPYKGIAPVMQDMGGDLVDLAIIAVGEPQVALAQQGRLKILGTLAPAGRVEVPMLKAYPSINDSPQFKDFAFNIWTGYFVRRDTPEPVVQALHKALDATLGDPEVRIQLEKVGGMLAKARPQVEVDRDYASQTERFRAIARSIKLEAQ